MIDPAHEHARSQRRARAAEVSRFVSIPTVSGDPGRRNAIDAGAEWLRRRLSRAGLRVLPSPRRPGAPIVRARWRGRSGSSAIQQTIASRSWVTVGAFIGRQMTSPRETSRSSSRTGRMRCWTSEQRHRRGRAGGAGRGEGGRAGLAAAAL